MQRELSRKEITLAGGNVAVVCVRAKCFAVRIDNCDTSAKLFKDANCCLESSCTSCVHEGARLAPPR